MNRDDLVERMARAAYERAKSRLAADPVTIGLDGPRGCDFTDMVFPPWGEVKNKSPYLEDASAALELALEEAFAVCENKAAEWRAAGDQRAAVGCHTAGDAIRALMSGPRHE